MVTKYWKHVGDGKITTDSGRFVGVFIGDFRYRDRIIVAVNEEGELREEIASLKAQLASEKTSHAAWEQEHLRQAAEMEMQLVECKKSLRTIQELRGEAKYIFCGADQDTQDCMEWYSASIDTAVAMQKEEA